MMANTLEHAFQRAIDRFLPDDSDSDESSEDQMWLSLRRANEKPQSATTRKINDKSQAVIDNKFAAEIRHAFKKLDAVSIM